MKRYIKVWLLGIFMMFGILPIANAQVPFEFHSPYEYGVTFTAGGSGSYYKESPYHIGNSQYCVDLNAPTNAGQYKVTAIADGVVVADREEGSTDYHTAYDHDVAIDHGNGYYSLYMHLTSNSVSIDDEVRAGQVIGVEGDIGVDDHPDDNVNDHLHFCIFNSSDSSIVPSPMDGVVLGSEGSALTYGQQHGYTITSQNQEIPTNAYAAITAKADELWAHDLISTEISDMHWYGGPTATEESFIIEDWNSDGAWYTSDGNWIALTYNEQFDSAYVLRHGLWATYRNSGGPDMFGVPLGDEMDTTRTDYTPHDSYWGTNKSGAITNNCGPTNVFSSVQRFSEATLCWYAGQACLADPTADEGGEYLPFCCELTPYAKHICPSANPSGGTIPEDQYLFIDTDQNGVMDPCLRRGDLILCDENRDGDSDYAFSYGDGISATYFPLRFGVAVVYNYGTFYLDDDADGLTNRTITFGGSSDQGHYLGNGGALAIQRYTRYFLIDHNADGYEEWFYPFGWGTSTQHYYLTDMNGDNVTDLVFREGNLFTVDTSQDGSDDFYFTYGYGDSDDYYFADLISDGTDEVIVRRGDTFYVLLNESISRTCPSCSHTHDFSFSYGNGL